MLQEYLVQNLFALLLVFSRMGTTIMFLPGFGEAYVPPRIRLIFALAVTVIVAPLVAAELPPAPASPLSLSILLGGEATIGAFIGLLSRILISATHTAGMLIAMQSGLASAMMFDMNAGTQGSPFGNLLGVMAVCMLFSVNMHHLMLNGVISSYSLFLPGQFAQLGDFAYLASQFIASSFLMAFAFAAPHIVVGLMIYMLGGILSRLMPSMQVFFILMPAQIMVSIFILMITLSSAMMVYMNHFEAQLASFLEVK